MPDQQTIIEELHSVPFINSERGGSRAEGCSITKYQNLVTSGTWQEFWPGISGLDEAVRVTAEIWTPAIQKALDENKAVFIPYRQKPYYIDSPLILNSGNRLFIDPEAEIRLKPFTNTCMLRNKNILSGQDGPVKAGVGPDTDIIIEGGIWTTLATTPTQSNGNNRGQADSADSVFGAHGTILLHNVRQVQIRNVIIKQCRPFGVQIGNCSDFLIENILFENTRRDGIHVEGPASRGIIRNLRGITGDDVVALNAWDWKHYSITFGPIKNILVDGVAGAPQNGHNAIRLLGGTKKFTNGIHVDCDVCNIIVRNIHAINRFKIYDQPNLELGREKDFAEPIGRFFNIYFDTINITDRFVKETEDDTGSSFQLAADIDGLTIKNIFLAFCPGPDYKLVEIGPMSATWKPEPDNPDAWSEVFRPDKNCTVKNLKMSGLKILRSVAGKEKWIEADIQRFVWVRDQAINPDYPSTTPKGGTGKVFFVNPSLNY